MPGTSSTREQRAAPVRLVRDLAAACQHNLPSELSSFVGRAREIAELPEALAATRLLTLTGAGGVGKTRVALERITNWGRSPGPVRPAWRSSPAQRGVGPELWHRRVSLGAEP
jgi:hypothetical protein